MGDLLREETEDGILVLTLNRPDKMNALSEELRLGVRDAARESKVNDTIRCIVLTGNGRGFCAGADLSTGGPVRDVSEPRPRSQFVDKVGMDDMVLALEDADVPVLGAINGVAAGAGFGVALACDVRFASDQARMGPIFIKRGIGPDAGTSYFLPRLVGVAKALEILYRGDLMDAQTLLQLGLVNQVVPHDKLMDETMAFARLIAKGPPLAYTYTRRAILRSLEHDLRRHLEYERSNQNELLATADAAEGFKAFAEKREPDFTGH